MIGIYMYTDKDNGKRYIGQSTNINKRKTSHRNSDRTPFDRILSLKGEDKFDFVILEECEASQLNEREIYWINYYNSYEEGYNETRGGEGHFKFYPEEIIKLWDNGLSIYEITQQIGCKKQTVYNTLKDHPTFSTQISIERSAPRRNKLLSKAASDR